MVYTFTKSPEDKNVYFLDKQSILRLPDNYKIENKLDKIEEHKSLLSYYGNHIVIRDLIPDKIHNAYTTTQNDDTILYDFVFTKKKGPFDPVERLKVPDFDTIKIQHKYDIKREHTLYCNFYKSYVKGSIEIDGSYDNTRNTFYFNKEINVTLDDRRCNIEFFTNKLLSYNSSLIYNMFAKYYLHNNSDNINTSLCFELITCSSGIEYHPRNTVPYTVNKTLSSAIMEFKEIIQSDINDFNQLKNNIDTEITYKLLYNMYNFSDKEIDNNWVERSKQILDSEDESPIKILQNEIKDKINKINPQISDFVLDDLSAYRNKNNIEKFYQKTNKFFYYRLAAGNKRIDYSNILTILYNLIKKISIQINITGYKPE